MSDMELWMLRMQETGPEIPGWARSEHMEQSTPLLALWRYWPGNAALHLRRR